jgi:hypothetical protein
MFGHSPDLWSDYWATPRWLVPTATMVPSATINDPRFANDLRRCGCLRVVLPRVCLPPRLRLISTGHKVP